MDLNHALRFLGFPEDEIPALLEEANAYDPALLERAFADEAMECLPSGCAKKLLGTGLSASFVFHLAMRNVFLLVHCFPLETFRTVLGSDWGDILNENHERHAFGDERVYDFLDRLTTDHLTSDITDLCDTIRDELRTDEESEQGAAMHKLYFTRHGETVWNVENKICGMTDSPLTERGRAQARALGQKVKAGGYAIDEILYSPLSRAADTAKAIADATGIPARCEPRLREQCFGKYEGTPRNGEKFRISKTCFADRYDGGESMLQLAQRIYNLLDELRDQPDKTYLLVAHNGIARVVESYFHDMTNEEYALAGIRNCELVEYHFE